jgi:hypothetical protein
VHCHNNPWLQLLKTPSLLKAPWPLRWGRCLVLEGHRSDNLRSIDGGLTSIFIDDRRSRGIYSLRSSNVNICHRSVLCSMTFWRRVTSLFTTIRHRDILRRNKCLRSVAIFFFYRLTSFFDYSPCIFWSVLINACAGHFFTFTFAFYMRSSALIIKNIGLLPQRMSYILHSRPITCVHWSMS